MRRAPNVIDLTGRRFGRITVLESAGTRDMSRGALWKCRCDCGTVFVTGSDSLRRGSTRSCGCIRSELARKNVPYANQVCSLAVRVEGFGDYIGIDTGVHAGIAVWRDGEFERITGWKGRTSEHARDAAMLVFGRK